MALLTVDLHTHLLEKKVEPESYWRAVLEKGLDAVAITEHANHRPEKAYRALLAERPTGIGLVPGMELNTSIGHVLALGSDEGIYGEKGLLGKDIPIESALEIAGEKEIMLSIAHPWGFSYDSAAYILGETRLEKLVLQNRVGVEAFNGMFGNVGEFFYASNWVKKPMNFFDFLERSRIGRKTRLDRLGRKGREKLGSKGMEILERGMKPFGLGEKASFVTAGSDAHGPKKIGTGIMKLEAKERGPAGILEALKERKNVKWVGPFVRETESGYEISRAGIQKAEVLSGIKYAAKSALLKKVSRKGNRAKMKA